MISEAYKSAFSKRFKLFAGLIMNRGLAKDQTEFGKLMNASAQAVSQMIKGDRMATLEQIDKLSTSTGLNAHWLLTGEEPIFLEEDREREDIIVMVTKAVNDGQIPALKGQQIIEYIREIQSSMSNKDEEIHKLNDEIIELMRVIKKF